MRAGLLDCKGTMYDRGLGKKKKEQLGKRVFRVSAWKVPDKRTQVTMTASTPHTPFPPSFCLFVSFLLFLPFTSLLSQQTSPWLSNSLRVRPEFVIGWDMVTPTVQRGYNACFCMEEHLSSVALMRKRNRGGTVPPLNAI